MAQAGDVTGGIDGDGDGDAKPVAGKHRVRHGPPGVDGPRRAEGSGCLETSTGGGEDEGDGQGKDGWSAGELPFVGAGVIQAAGGESLWSLADVVADEREDPGPDVDRRFVAQRCQGGERRFCESTSIGEARLGLGQ